MPGGDLASLREEVQQLKGAVHVLTSATHLMAIPTASDAPGNAQSHILTASDAPGNAQSYIPTASDAPGNAQSYIPTASDAPGNGSA